MPDMLTRADLANMTPADVEKARREGRIEGVSDGSEQEGGKKPDRRKQRTRSQLLALQRGEGPSDVADPEEDVEQKIGAGVFDGILDGATHVIDVETGTIYEVTGTNEDDLEPVIKSQNAAGEDMEDLVSKSLQFWVPLTDQVYVKAAEAVDDSQTKASAWPLPLKPARADSITSGDMVVVDPDNSAVLVQLPTEKEKKREEADAKADAANKDEARRNARAGVLSSPNMTGGN